MTGHRIPALLLLLAAAGCSSYRLNARPREEVRTLLPFLEEGTTSREAALQKLGPPTYEDRLERVCSWRLSRDGFGALVTAGPTGTFGWGDAQFDLVLAFDDRHVLEECALLQLKETGPW